MNISARLMRICGLLFALMANLLLPALWAQAELAKSGHMIKFARIAGDLITPTETAEGGASFRFSADHLVEVTNSSRHAEGAFLAWVRLDSTRATQRMILAKNRYALNEREWGLLVDEDGMLRLYVYQGTWHTIAARDAVKMGEWLQVAFQILPGQATLWVNGQVAGQIKLEQLIATTAAPVTIGGVNDAGVIRQPFVGVIENVRVVSGIPIELALQGDYRALQSAKAKDIVATQIESTGIANGASGGSALQGTKPVSEQPKAIENATLQEVELWDASLEIPAADEMLTAESVTLSQVRAPEMTQSGGFVFMHGMALVWHRGRLYASFGYNAAAENTPGEKVFCMVSENGGNSWYQSHLIDEGDQRAGSAISHGVFHSADGKLWAFLAGFRGAMQKVRTRLYLLDERTNSWKFQGVVAKEGFWPLQEPQKMDDGNWIMAGVSLQGGNFPAVAISRGNDITVWDVVVIPRADHFEAWSESAVIVAGNKVTNISRHGPSRRAYVAESVDYGRSWVAARRSNLSMADSKPYAGRLSTGERYLIGTTTADTIDGRSPLTIALSRPNEDKFSRILIIRPAILPRPAVPMADPLARLGKKAEGPKALAGPESAADARLAYPYAIERYGMLYVGYSNSGNRGVGNSNSMELAIIPLKSLSK